MYALLHLHHFKWETQFYLWQQLFFKAAEFFCMMLNSRISTQTIDVCFAEAYNAKGKKVRQSFKTSFNVVCHKSEICKNTGA